jgi:hypothetical protein
LAVGGSIIVQMVPPPVLIAAATGERAMSAFAVAIWGKADMAFCGANVR